LKSLAVMLGLLCVSLSIDAASLRFADVIEKRTRQSVEIKARRLQVSDTAATDSLRLWLQEEGYLDAQVSRKVDTLIVVVGSRYQFDKLIVTADSSFEQKVGGYFTKTALDDAVTLLLQEYYARGYYYVRASVGSIEREGASVVAHLQVTPGPVVTVGDLKFAGLTRTKPGYIRQLLPIRSGDTLTDALIDRVEQSAGEINFAEFIPPVLARPRFGYTQVDLELRMRERQQFLFAGGAGYVNDARSGLVWDLALELPNLFGEGKQITAQSSRREKGRNLLNLSYRQPAFWLGRGDLRADLTTRDYRDNFYEFALQTGYAVSVGKGTTVGTVLGWKRVEPSDSIGYSRYQAGMTFQRRVLDDGVNPTHGHSLKTSVVYAHRKYSNDSASIGRTYNDTRAALDASVYQPVVGNLVAMLGVGFMSVETQEEFLPISELYLIGGPGTLRGFRNEQFAAQRAVLATIEPRLRFAGSYLFGFYDAAFLQRPVQEASGVSLDESYEYGFGGGLALVTPARSVSLSLGWNRDLNIEQPYLSIKIVSSL
jgi:outer membrane protein assembly factor BamA